MYSVLMLCHFIVSDDECVILGTDIKGLMRLMRGMANLPQGNQELLVVRDKAGRPPDDLGKQVHGM